MINHKKETSLFDLLITFCQIIDRSEWDEFVSRFLCVIGKQRRTENAGMGLTMQYLYIN